MERIILEVDETVGKVYRQFSPESKKEFSQAVSLMLKKAVNDASFSDYMVYLDAIGNKAIGNGLTSDKLDELLKTHE
jgi:predicted double-glycine peptidase